MKNSWYCTVKEKTISYPLDSEKGLFQKEYLIEILHAFAKPLILITDSHVLNLYALSLKQRLVQVGCKVKLIAFPAGEKSKTRETKCWIEDQILQTGWGKDIGIIALGGGVVTDLAGYVAATYCRGVPLFLVPTSLLAMVDACIGGKTGVNTPWGKNLIGTIYQPCHIFIDPELIRSLPINELKQGIVEMIKHALIADKDYFDCLQYNSENFFLLQTDRLEEWIVKSCWIKKRIVEEEVQDRGKRLLLNYGHTVAHALETLTGYTISHGDAVAFGIIVESYLSKALHHLSEKDFQQICHIFRTYQIGLPRKEIDFEKLINLMKMDKKAIAQQPRFILLQEIGSPCDVYPFSCTTVDQSLLLEALKWAYDDLSNG